MQVNPNKQPEATLLVTSGQAARTATARPVTVAFEETEALHAALQELPDVRADQVERGRHLVSTTSYPPPETIRRIATLLAFSWAHEPRSD